MYKAVERRRKKANGRERTGHKRSPTKKGIGKQKAG